MSGDKDRLPSESINWRELNPLASDPQPEDRPNGHHSVDTAPQIPPQAFIKLAGEYRRATGSLEGGDRDKIRALEKRARRIRRAIHAGNANGFVSISAVRSNIVNGRRG